MPSSTGKVTHPFPRVANVVRVAGAFTRDGGHAAMLSLVEATESLGRCRVLAVNDVTAIGAMAAVPASAG